MAEDKRDVILQKNILIKQLKTTRNISTTKEKPRGLVPEEVRLVPILLSLRKGSSFLKYFLNLCRKRD